MNTAALLGRLKEFARSLPTNALGIVKNQPVIDALTQAYQAIELLQTQLAFVQEELQKREAQHREQTAALAEALRQSEMRSQRIIDDANRQKALIIQEAEIAAEKIEAEATRKAKEKEIATIQKLKEMEYEQQKKHKESYQRMAVENGRHQAVLVNAQKVAYDILSLIAEFNTPYAMLQHKVEELKNKIKQLPLDDDAILFVNRKEMQN